MAAVRKTRVLVPLTVKLYPFQAEQPGHLGLLPDSSATSLICRVVGGLPGGLCEEILLRPKA